MSATSPSTGAEPAKVYLVSIVQSYMEPVIRYVCTTPEKAEERKAELTPTVGRYEWVEIDEWDLDL